MISIWQGEALVQLPAQQELRPPDEPLMRE